VDRRGRDARGFIFHHATQRLPAASLPGGRIQRCLARVHFPPFMLCHTVRRLRRRRSLFRDLVVRHAAAPSRQIHWAGGRDSIILRTAFHCLLFSKTRFNPHFYRLHFAPYHLVCSGITLHLPHVVLMVISLSSVSLADAGAPAASLPVRAHSTIYTPALFTAAGRRPTCHYRLSSCSAVSRRWVERLRSPAHLPPPAW